MLTHALLLFGPLYVAISLLQYTYLTFLMWAYLPLLTEEMTVHFEFHPHMDHNVGYSLALCPSTL